MVIRTPLVLVVLLLLAPAVPAWGQFSEVIRKPGGGTLPQNGPPSPPSSASRGPAGLGSKPIPASYVSTLKDDRSQQTVVINYPWQVHAQSSVEVRLVLGEQEEEATSVVPVYFQSDYFKGDIGKRIYRTLDLAGDRSNSDSFTKDKIDFKILGQRNSLGRSSVVVLPERDHAHPGQSPTVVFPILSQWALGNRLLTLDLPRELFAKRGTLHVWFLRADKVLWEETVEWPGF